MFDKAEYRKTLVRYGDIVQDKSWQDSTGHYRETIFKYEGVRYRVRMYNGEVITLAKIK